MNGQQVPRRQTPLPTIPIRQQTGTTPHRGTRARLNRRTATPHSQQQPPSATADRDPEEAFQEAVEVLLAIHNTDSLFRHFREKLYTTHYSWRKPLVEIVRKLIPKIIVNDDIDMGKKNTVALFSLTRNDTICKAHKTRSAEAY